MAAVSRLDGWVGGLGDGWVGGWVGRMPGPGMARPLAPGRWRASSTSGAGLYAFGNRSAPACEVTQPCIGRTSRACQAPKQLPLPKHTRAHAHTPSPHARMPTCVRPSPKANAMLNTRTVHHHAHTPPPCTRTWQVTKAELGKYLPDARMRDLVARML